MIHILENGGTMVNATEMAKPFDKRPIDWIRLPSTHGYLKALTDVRFSHNAENLIITERGGSVEGGGGTWMHEDVAPVQNWTRVLK